MLSFAMSSGTATGMIIAIVATVGFTGYLTWSKKTLGTEPIWGRKQGE